MGTRFLCSLFAIIVRNVRANVLPMTKLWHFYQSSDQQVFIIFLVSAMLTTLSFYWNYSGGKSKVFTMQFVNKISYNVCQIITKVSPAIKIVKHASKINRVTLLHAIYVQHHFNCLSPFLLFIRQTPLASSFLIITCLVSSYLISDLAWWSLSKNFRVIFDETSWYFSSTIPDYKKPNSGRHTSSIVSGH